MSKIDQHVYKREEFLPSCHALALKYGVSAIIIRRTLKLLGQMGITETLNGIGTKVVAGIGKEPGFTNPRIRKNVLLYLQAM
ncbi:GntR family transcriptional regulator [Hungatella effluvii]|uniref:GntR family transcriptional regulator n=1 Tax=Hungatella effluvii TaxID=1096246 RepID=UPI002A8103DE|nr:GntR family transcriptional regulator [Hungatella effluvii]